MRQQHDLALFSQRKKLRIDRRFMLEHIKTGARNFALLNQLDQRIFIDNLTTRRVDQIGCRLHERYSAG
ncbi:hypothetical protein D3C71_2098100 [compost metagenome]